jgi:hypothetical protein
MSKEIEAISINNDVQPITETQPPLVIDLPEGQKMVVGKLDPDTVIEVATWRGTGRPDSRTNRLMLGVSSNSNQSIETQADQSAVNLSIQNQTQVSSQPIITGHQHSYASVETATEQIKQIEMEKKMRSKSRFKGLLAALLILAITSLAFGPLGLRFAHPKDGVGTFLGSASTSIAIVKPIKQAKVGTNVITDLKNRKDGPIMGTVSVASNDDLLVSTNITSYQVRSENLHGRVVAVLPFIGWIASLFSNG